MSLSKVYTKSPCDLASIIAQINADPNITIGLDLNTTHLFGDQLMIAFKSDMADWTQVDADVAANSGLPFILNQTHNVAVISQPSVTVSSQPLPAPFAQPTYRTKDNPTSSWVTCTADAATNID